MIAGEAPMYTFNMPGRLTATSGAFWDVIPPLSSQLQTHPGLNGIATLAPRNRGKHKTHVNRIVYTTPADAHSIVVARPCNFAIVAAAVSAGATSITLDSDPGNYSANYRYGSLVGGIPAQAANNLIGSGHYIALQMSDGTWKAVTVTGGSWSSTTSSISINALPSNNSIGVSAGALCYFFGNVTSDVDPATGRAQALTVIPSSQNLDTSWSDTFYGGVAALHSGDPLLFYSENNTAQGWLDGLSGYFGILE
jgi:hypothetical protein